MADRRAATRRAATGLIVTVLTLLMACGDDDDADSTTTLAAPASTAATTSAATTTTVPVTTPAPTEPSAATSSTPATVPPTTAPPTLAVPTTVVPASLSGETVEIVSPLMPTPFLLERAATSGELVAYDGEATDGDFVLRCLAVGHDGDTAWSEWCVLPGDSGSFVVVDGIDPWVVDVGLDHLDVTMTQMPSDWAVTTSGCVDPLVTLIEAGDIAPAAATGLACAGGEAFLTYSSVFMQPGPVDGGGMLLTNSDEGWGTSGGGTSFSCSDWLDGVDRCDQFGVESGGEMFEATTPLPSAELIAAQQDFVMVREITDEVQPMTAGAPDVDAAIDAIVAGLTASAEAEVEPTVVRHDGLSFDRYTLLVVDVPLLDDSTRSTTSAVWITTPTEETLARVHKAYAWNNCARGVTDDLCG